MSFFLLSHAAIIRAQGEDTTRYLNARLSNDIPRLSVGHSCLAGMLTAQGKTLGVFRILKCSETEYVLVSDHVEDLSETLSSLGQFIVADRVTLTHQEQDQLLHFVSIEDAAKVLPWISSDLSADSNDSAFATSQEEGLIACRSKRTPQTGIDLIGPQEKVQEVVQSLSSGDTQELSEAQQTLLRIKANCPMFPIDISKDRIFHESGLSEAISYTKGCYVGQEVIERIDSHGKTAQVLQRLELEGKVDLVQNSTVGLESDSGENQFIGKTVSSAYDQELDRTYCFAYVKNKEYTSEQAVLVNGSRGRILA